jgi:hypothetical protein
MGRGIVVGISVLLLSTVPACESSFEDSLSPNTRICTAPVNAASRIAVVAKHGHFSTSAHMPGPALQFKQMQ